MLKTLLVPLDGSSLSEQVLPIAAELARAAQAQIILIRAIGNAARRTLSAGEPPIERSEAAASLSRIGDQLRSAGLAVQQLIEEDEAGRTILASAQKLGVDLILMSTHGRSGLGRWLYGSVAEQVICHAVVPILLVPPTAGIGWPAGAGGGRPRIVVALDGSRLSRKALAPASDLAWLMAAELLLLRVVEPAPPADSDPFDYQPPFDQERELTAARRYLEAIAVELRSAGHPVSTRVVVGPPATLIAAVAREQGAVMIALATQVEGGLKRLILGSVALGVLRKTDVPLLLARSATLAVADYTRSRTSPAETGQAGWEPLGDAGQPERQGRAVPPAGASESCF